MHIQRLNHPAGMATVVTRGLVLLAILILPGGCAFTSLFKQDLVLSQIEMTDRLAARFPIERNIADLLRVKLSRPRVSISPTDTANSELRLAVGVDLEVNLPLSSKTLFGQMTLSGMPRYDEAAGAIFLQNARVEQVRVDNMPNALSAALAKSASQLAGEHFAEKAIYTLNKTERMRSGQSIRVARIELRPNQLVVVLK